MHKCHLFSGVKKCLPIVGKTDISNFISASWRPIPRIHWATYQLSTGYVTLYRPQRLPFQYIRLVQNKLRVVFFLAIKSDAKTAVSFAPTYIFNLLVYSPGITLVLQFITLIHSRPLSLTYFYILNNYES